jgi:integrase
MARSFRKKKRINAAGEVFYQIFGPNPKTGKEEYRETIKGAGDIATRANKRVKELTAAAFGLTDYGKRETRTVADLAEAFMNDRRERCRWTVANDSWHDKGKSFSPNSLDGYERAVALFKPTLGPIILIALELDDVQRVVDELTEEHGPSKGRSVGVVLRAMLRWGFDFDWTMQPRLMLRLSRLRIPPPRVREEIPHDEDVRACLAVVFGPRGSETRRDYLHRRWLWLMMLANGPRRGEITSLRWENLDLDNSVGRIEEGYCAPIARKKPTKSKAGKRPLYIPRQAYEVLDAIKETDGEATGLIMKSRTGNSTYTSIGSTIRLIRDKANIPEDRRHLIHTHGMRSWVTSHLDFRGVNEGTRKLLIGHAGSRDVTAGYTKVLPQALSHAFAVIQAVVDDLMPTDITPLSEAMTVGSHLPEYRRAYYQKNRTKMLEASQQYRQKNIGWIRERDRLRMRLQRADTWRTNESQDIEEAP